MTDMTVANTILAQLGGNKMSVMIGVKNLVGSDKSLKVMFKARAKDGINEFIVTLDPSDTYTVAFAKNRGMNYKVVDTMSDVYADDLVRVCERRLGLDFHL